jgi:hypothetical protein
MRDAHLATEEAIERAAEIHTMVATDQAREAGNLDPAGGGSFTHPDITRTFSGDGKVMKPLYSAKPGAMRVNRKAKRKRRVRFDPDAGLYQEGGNKRKTWGLKFAFLNTRRREGRFILAIEHVENKRRTRRRQPSTCSAASSATPPEPRRWCGT